jgi:hypothetical protein
MLLRLFTAVALLAFAYSAIKVLAFKEYFTRPDCVVLIVSAVTCFVLNFVDLERRIRRWRRRD